MHELQSGNGMRDEQFHCVGYDYQVHKSYKIFFAIWLSNYEQSLCDVYKKKLHLKGEGEQGKSEGFDSCDRPSNLTQNGFKSSVFQPVWPWYLMDDPKNNGDLFYATLSFLHHFVAIGEYKLELQSRNA